MDLRVLGYSCSVAYFSRFQDHTGARCRLEKLWMYCQYMLGAVLCWFSWFDNKKMSNRITTSIKRLGSGACNMGTNIQIYIIQSCVFHEFIDTCVRGGVVKQQYIQ